MINGDRKSTRLNSSHLVISYAVFCLKKKRLKPAREQGRSRSQIERDQTAKPRDPVIDVHDIIADSQIAKVRKKGRGPRASLLLAPDGGGASLKCRLGSFIEEIA